MPTVTSVIADGQGGPEVLAFVQRELSEPGLNEMLVRVCAAGVNRADSSQRLGEYPPPFGASDVLGLELAGVVEAAGSAVTRFAVGDRVMALVASGAYAERAIVHEDVALAVPENMSLVEAGAVPETYFTVWSNVFDRASLQRGESLLIHGGTSGIGTTAILLGRAFGTKILVTAGSEDKCEAALKIGAHHAINYRMEDFVSRARELTDGKGPDVILDMVGGSYLQRNIDLIAVDGRIAQIDFLQGSRADLDLGPLLYKRAALTASTLRARPIPMKARLARALEQHVLPLFADGKAKPVIDSIFPFEKVRDAHARMDDGHHIGKIVLQMDAEAT